MMKSKMLLMVFVLCALTGCPRQAEPTEQLLVSSLPLLDAQSSDPPFCRLMSDPAVTGVAIDALRTSAEMDLRERKPRMTFDFERATAGPIAGQVSLLFANLTYLDQYYVYVGQMDGGRIERVYRLGGFYYAEAKCE